MPVFCTRLGIITPRNLRDISLKEALLDPSAMNGVLNQIVSSKRSVYENITLSAGRDKFVWEGCDSGQFSTKLFRESYQTIWQRVSWGACIWASWFPKKVSFLIWKYFHGAIPTDNKVQSAGVSIASKCVCCSLPKMETANHLFFRSDLAVSAWEVFGALTGDGRIFGIQSLIKYLVEHNRKHATGRWKFGLACCVIFEIWKWRNQVVYNDRILDIKRALRKWFSDINKLLPGNREVRAHCEPFTHSDAYIAVSVVNVNGMVFGSAILSKQGGSQILFGKEIPIADGFSELIHVLSEAAVEAQTLGIDRIVSSNAFMSWLGLYEDEVPWNALLRRRMFLAKFKRIYFSRVCPARNNGALAVAYAACRGESLARPSAGVLMALNNFQPHRKCFHKPLFNEDRLRWPSSVRDDAWIAVSSRVSFQRRSFTGASSAVEGSIAYFQPEPD